VSNINYNNISQVYDKVRQSDLTLVKHLISGVTIDDDFKTLEIGCGTGNYSDLFQRLTNSAVCGVDPSTGMLSQVCQKNPHIDYRNGRADAIPFDDSIFDFAFMTDVIHHVPDLTAMFAEIRRVLKPAARLCIATQSHAQIAIRPIATFFPATMQVDQGRYPEIGEILTTSQLKGFNFLKQEVLFAGREILLDQSFLQLVRLKGYSMLHLITPVEYQDGLQTLETALKDGPIKAKAAGETLLWLCKAV
jgi:ubiquinone/menaquinone biosynthesis C-methylase UbiE